MEHLRKRDRAGLEMDGGARPVLRGEIAQQFQVGFALLLEVIEGIFWIGLGVKFDVELRVVRLKLRVGLAEEPVEAAR